MVVWIPESADLAEIPGVGATAEQDGVRLAASHCWRADTLLALSDGVRDASPRMTFWPHRGTDEWVSMTFDAPRRVSTCRVLWFDDTGQGSCRLPKSALLSIRAAGKYLPAVPVEVAPGKESTLRFEPVLAESVRLDVRLADGFSAGILEWQVE